MDNYLFSFEKLDVWHQARAYVREVYKLTNSFPQDERFGLISQLRRAAVSVSSNIAEGATRHSFKDQAHFSEIAYGSLMETMSQFFNAVDLDYIQESDLIKIRDRVHHISRMLTALRKYQLDKAGK